MPIEQLELGVVATLQTGVQYALPSFAVYIYAQAGGTLEVSNDGATWAALGATNPVAAKFIRSTVNPTIVLIQRA